MYTPTPYMQNLLKLDDSIKDLIKDCKTPSDKIKKLRQITDLAHSQVNEIAVEYIPDFHFMDYKVSTFWPCEKSPIGMCVMELNDYCEPTYCRYCAGLMERK